MQDEGTVREVNKVNTEFYHAFESLSIEMMDKLWKHDENVVNNTQRMRFIITNTKVRIFDNIKIAVVVCLENIETSANGQVIKIGVIATNIFERNELSQWLLIHHHGSSVTNYIPPNISSQ